MEKSPLSNLLEKVEAYLEQLVEERYPLSEQLSEAIRYALLGPGKRVRAQMTLLTAQTLGANFDKAMPAAAAVEMVHAYSLVHDDLPCIDNDDWRRGRPSLHKQFDEARAVLVGDALLTDSFHLLTQSADLSDRQRLMMVRELSRAAGSAGMASGQALDIYWTARPGGSVADLDDVHLKKTGALMGAAASMGALAAGGCDADVERFRLYGENVGLAFQIIDDLIDTRSGTGKSQGKDQDAAKFTYPVLMPIEEAQAKAEQVTTTARELLQVYGDSALELLEFTHRLLERQK